MRPALQNQRPIPRATLPGALHVLLDDPAAEVDIDQDLLCSLDDFAQRRVLNLLFAREALEPSGY